MPERAEIGRVRSVNPARREVRVTPRRGYERALTGRREIEFAVDGGKRVAFAIETVEEQDKCVKLTLAAGTSTDGVASLRGARVLAGAARESTSNPFHMAAEEFTGFAVVDMDGNAVGVLASGFNTPAHGVIEIELAAGKSVLAPFVADVIARVDLAKRVIVLRDREAHLVEQHGDGTMA